MTSDERETLRLVAVLYGVPLVGLLIAVIVVNWDLIVRWFR